MIDVQTFKMTSNIPLTIHPHTTIVMSTIIVHVIDSGMYPSRNSTCVILTNFSHF